MRAWKRDIDPTSKTEEIFIDSGDTLPALFNVDSRDIKEGKKIGEGNWAVHEAEWLGRKVAVKKFVAESTFSNVSLTSREVNRMLGLQHPNVLKLLGFCLTTQKEQVLDCTMIMELMDFDLEDYIGKGALSDDQVIYITAEVSRGMKHIHKKGCFHRDLKPKNVLLRKSAVTRFYVDVKIADFGSSELLGVVDMNRTSGTMGYKAPEQFDSTSKLFPDKLDVFGFGALCFKILTGKRPYESRRNVRETIKQLDRAAISQRNLPEDVVQIIWECLDVNPDLRPNFKKIFRILDGALSAIQEKMPRPLPLSPSPSLHSRESILKGVEGHNHLFHEIFEVAKEYEVHFIPSEELLVIGLIAQGVDASVYKVEWKGIFYAQKVFKKVDETLVHSPFDFSWKGEKYFQTLPKLLHKNIVTFMGYSMTSDYEISIILELLAMNLSEALDSHRFGERKSYLDIKERWMIVRGIAEGMKYLHGQGVVHGDLKPSNVVLSKLDTNEVIVKLIDFANYDVGRNTKYAAPETYKIKQLRQAWHIDEKKKADVYSFGILWQEVLGGAPLLKYYEPRKYRDAIVKGKRPPIPIGTSPEMKCLLQGCWNGNPLERPSFFEVCERLSQISNNYSSQGQTYLEYFVHTCCVL